MKPANRALMYACFVSLGGFVFGFDASVISGVIGFVVGKFNLNEWEQGLVVSAPTLGALIAASAAGIVADAIGRRKVLKIIAFLYLLSAVASAFAPNYQALVVARFIGGLAFASLMIAPMYIAEISPASLRGKMVSINQLNIMIGFSAAYFGNYFLLKLSGSDAAWVRTLGIDEAVWRWMLGIEVLPAAAFFLLLFFIPESPRWLVVKGRFQRARTVLQELQPHADVNAQIQAIKETSGKSRESLLHRFRQLFGPKVRYALIIGLIVGVAQQITGINAVYFYAPSIFEQSGVGKDAAFAQAASVGIINVVFTVIAMALIDRLGRKPLLIWGLSGVFLSMSLCAYGFYSAKYRLDRERLAPLAETVDVAALEPLLGQAFADDVSYKVALREALGDAVARANEAALIQAGIRMNPWLILIGILGFVASFAISLGPVMWVLFSEIFPNRIRGLAISFVGAINSLVSFGVQFLFPWEVANLGAPATFAIYGFFALIGLGLVAWLVPETKGKSLEQLETELARGRSGGGVQSPSELNPLQELS
ncbi:Sugar porter family MFS transporter [Sulfidibacter corallicola]|uniref:Sugar porter family MFS transporter n=1 Tax=Sulfidibacter corallicola TaxID=2818388 RepID=A0A8A4TKR7_SULCO|nr:sugar porter family MFS transporter [Sulfidibacter corallicola]QTD49722.1 sugar porter family MFS transporter [Sulfidibacter corallicola]